MGQLSRHIEPNFDAGSVPGYKLTSVGAGMPLQPQIPDPVVPERLIFGEWPH